MQFKAEFLLMCLLLCACAPTPVPTPTHIAAPRVSPTPFATVAQSPTADAQNARVRLDPTIETYWISGPEILELAPKVYATHLATQARTLLFQAPVMSKYMAIRNIFSAAWSPDGERVLLSFAGSDAADGTLRLVSADGKQVENFLDAPKVAYHYALWSPDGANVVARSAKAPFCLQLLARDGAVVRDLSCEPLEYPRFWSVDGKWVAVGRYSANPSSEDWRAVSVENGESVRLKEIVVPWYDERYFPWRKLDTFQCSVSADPRAAKTFSFWRCE